MNRSAPRLSFRMGRGATRAGSPWIVAPSGHLRAPWRLAVFAAAFVVSWVMANAFLYPVLTFATSWMDTPPALYSWLLLAASLSATVIALRQVDGQEWEAVALAASAWRPAPLGRGLAVGGAAIGVVLVVLWGTGGARVEWLGDGSGPSRWIGTAWRALWFLAPAALWEEVIFRGYLWRVAEDAAGTSVALWATSVAFGAVHLLNPGATVQSLGIVVLAGVALGVVRRETDSLPAAWAAHLVWNWSMAAVAHAPVSGLPFEAPGWRFVPSGPDWWSGGSWGPEGGAVSFGVLLAAILWHHRVRARGAGAAVASSNIRPQPTSVAASRSR